MDVMRDHEHIDNIIPEAQEESSNLISQDGQGPDHRMRESLYRSGCSYCAALSNTSRWIKRETAVVH